MTKREWPARALVVILTLILAACRREEAPVQRELRIPRPPPLTDLQVAEHWLACIDCRGPFLRNLSELPPERRDTVVQFLRAALLLGPDSARTARHQQDLLRTWRDDSLYRVRRGEPPPKEAKTAFLARYRRGFEVKWRGRAAMALGVIPSPMARAALDSAMSSLPSKQGMEDPVLQMVKEARSDKGREAVKHFP